MGVPLGPTPYVGQSRGEHAAVLLGGAAVCLVGYVGTAALILPGVAFAAGLLTFWASVLGENAVEEWQREHLSPAFRRAFVEE